MQYLIMCGGKYPTPKGLRVVNGEALVERTIRLLKEQGVKEIAITSNDERFDGFGVPRLIHSNTFGEGGHWLEGFYPTDKPTCYIFGDVYFSPEAIKTIVETKTDDIEFFASSIPCFVKRWAEPFAFKVENQKYFRACINATISLAKAGMFNREPISWELWQVVKGTELNRIDYSNYTAIDDYSCDIDTDKEYEELKEALERMSE